MANASGGTFEDPKPPAPAAQAEGGSAPK
jgi:hypothetical protein